MSLQPFLHTLPIPRATASAGTEISVPVPPRKGLKTKLSFAQITSGGTAHTWYVLHELGRTTLYSAAAGAATSLVLTKDPGLYTTNTEWSARNITPSASNNAIAANDWIGIELADGTFIIRKVSAASTNSTTGRVTLTVSAIGAAGALAGATVWFLGIGTDTDPHTNLVNTIIAPAASATSTYPAAAGASGAAIIASSFHPYSPLILINANATAASVFDYGTAAYSDA